MRRGPVPYKELDPPIIPIVRVLNRFPGIRTIGSCGGHDSPNRGQAGPGQWWVLFDVDRSDEGWISLEFLSWAINTDMAGSFVMLLPVAPPPYLNHPGQMLRFRMECVRPDRDDMPAELAALLPELQADREGDTPAGLAAWLTELRQRFYVTAKQASRWPTD